MVYADEGFYMNQYLLGRKPLITVGFEYYARAASREMNRYLNDIPRDCQEPAGLCCCEVAEALFRYDGVAGGTSAPLVSYSNDGQSGEFDMTDYTKEGHQRNIYGIIRKYFEDTGLLYTGVG